jgi:DUF3037 family protein
LPQQPPNTLRYNILRYTPNLVRDEWVNIGVLLEEVGGARRALRMIEESSEMARVRRLHPNADEELLRGLAGEFDARLREPEEAVRTYLEKLGQALSNVIQLSPQKAVFADDFDAELVRLYREHVAPPPRARGGLAENARNWLRGKLRDVFRRHHIERKVKENVRVEQFTHPGDTFKFDYAYRNGAEGYVQSVLLARDMLPSKALAYTAGHIRKHKPAAEITAVTDTEPAAGNLRHEFLIRLFEEQKIRVVPMSGVEKFAEELRVRLQ